MQHFIRVATKNEEASIFQLRMQKKKCELLQKKRYEFFLDNCSILTLIATFP